MCYCDNCKHSEVWVYAEPCCSCSLGSHWEPFDSNGVDDVSVKRCPFCGGEAIVDRFSPPFRHSTYYLVRCTDCGAMTWPYGRDAEVAIKLWNGRAE